MMKKFSIAMSVLAIAFGMNSCTNDDLQEGMEEQEAAQELAAAQTEIAKKFTRAGRMQCAPVQGPTINKITYTWENPIDLLTMFPESQTPEGVYHNFVYYSNGEPFDVVMLYSNGAYRHTCGIYWYDEDGDCHEQVFWDEREEAAKDWYNANGQKTDIVSRKTDQAGAYTIQLPKGTKFSFFQVSYQATQKGWEVVQESVRLEQPAGPVVACPYKFYTEYSKNWNYQLTQKGQAMTKNVNDWTIVGFEDISLTWPSCDKDFNDCVFAINPAQDVTPNPTPEIIDGSVETNLSVAQQDGTDKVKLSVHVRAITDVEIVLPIKDEALADDFAIVAKHDIEYAYSEPIKIGEQTVSLNYSTTPEGYLKITTSGITEDIIQYCKNTYADGLTFECNFFFGKFDLQSAPTITFTKQPTIYITSCVTNSTEATDKEVEWKVPNVSKIDELWFETNGGDLIYSHNVYSPYNAKKLKEMGLITDAE